MCSRSCCWMWPCEAAGSEDKIEECTVVGGLDDGADAEVEAKAELEATARGEGHTEPVEE